MSVLTSRTELLTISDLDWFHVVDVSDTTDSPQGTSKKIKKGTLFSAIGGGAWGEITGTLSAQSDLQSALDGKSNVGHTHTTSQITNFNSSGDARWSLLGHTHTTSQITNLSSYTGFDSRYYTESESDGKYLLNTTDTLTGTLSVTGQINVNSNVVATGNIYGTVGVFGSNSSPLRLIGSGTGISNQNYIQFYESDGSTRQGYVGFPSPSQGGLYISSDFASTSLYLHEDGGVNGLRFVDNGGTGTVWTSRNDGSGSGLDADTLDGKQATDFVHYEYPLNGSGVFVSSNSGRIGQISNSGTDLGGSLPDSFGSLFTFQGSTDSRGFAFYHPNSSNSVLFAGLATGDGSVTYRRIGFMDTTNTGNFTATGTMTATAFFESSDITLKTNINKISPTFSSFEFKSNKGQKRYGVIAQEIEKTNPELVETNDEGLKSVNYIDLLVMKVAEQENKLQEQGEKIQRLEILVEQFLKD